MKSTRLKTLYAAAAIIMVLALAVMLARRTPFDQQAPAVGMRAPAVHLADMSAEMITLGDHRGDVVLVNFWATWCPPCVAELEWFERLYTKYREQGFFIIAIATDTINLEQAMELEVSFPVAMANDRVRESYGGVSGVPVSFLIGRDGKIIKKVRKAWPEESLKAEIEKALAQSPGQNQ